ncbi:MAG: hypothetical protein ABI588_11210 [Arenimonas sp.]
MRRELVLSLFLLLPAAAESAEAPPPRPAGEAHLQPFLVASLRQWVVRQAKDIGDATPDVAAIGAAARERLSGQDFGQSDIDALVQYVLQQCANDAEADLRSTMAQMQATNKRKQAQREAIAAQKQHNQAAKQELREEYATREQPTAPEANSPTKPEAESQDSLSDNGELMQVRLQQAQDRHAKLVEMLSNIMKKTSDTNAAITANLK